MRTNALSAAGVTEGIAIKAKSSDATATSFTGRGMVCFPRERKMPGENAVLKRLNAALCTLRCQAGKFFARLARESRLTISACSRKIAATAIQVQAQAFDSNHKGTAKSTMYIHMFAFRFKNGVTSDQKNHCVTEIRKLKD